MDVENKRKNFFDILDDTISTSNVEIKKDNNEDEIKKSKELKFKNEWKVWYHNMNIKNWKITGFEMFHTINNVYDFWRLFKYLSDINFSVVYLFIMRENISPIWEDEMNRNGGTCSIRVNLKKYRMLFEELTIACLIDSLVSCNSNEINGISLIIKGNWALIKLLTKNKDLDITKFLNKEIVDKYTDVSYQFKQNVPEY
jgi:hypothetical protein